MQTIWKVLKLILIFSIYAAILISSSSLRLAENHSIPKIALVHTGFTISVITLIVTVFSISFENTRSNTSSNINLLGVSLLATLTFLATGFQILSQLSHLVLAIELTFLFSALALFIYIISRIGITAAIERYVVSILNFALFLFITLVLMKNIDVLNLLPQIDLPKSQSEPLSLAAAVLSCFLGTIFVLAHGLKRSLETKSLNQVLIVLFVIICTVSAPPTLFNTLQPWATLICLLLTAAGYFLILMLCKLESQEKDDFESPPHWRPSKTRMAITEQESSNLLKQNHLVSLTEVKPGTLRCTALRLVLLFVGTLNILEGKRSELSGIVTIHFARWIIIDGHRLLFMTNYSGTWDSYLDEFIDRSSRGLTAIWSNTKGFPRAQWLTGGGAQLEQRFKAYARRSQLETLCYYSAYPMLSVNEIEENFRLNNILLNGKRTDADCEAVLRML